MKKIVVLGAGGFIGSHLVRKLKSMGNYVTGIDVKHPEFSKTQADEFCKVDATDYNLLDKCISADTDEIYQLAADMGGAGYIFTGENDLNVMLNSATINLNVARIIKEKNIPMVFFSSSACIYPEHNQMSADNPNCEESSAYPANPDSEYGWEKLFSERLYGALARDNGTKVRVARYHNVFGPEGTWQGGKEKAPAAICRKVAVSKGSIEIWGDGRSWREFLYVDDFAKCAVNLMASCNYDDLYDGVINIGSGEDFPIETLADIIGGIVSDNKYKLVFQIYKPQGVEFKLMDSSRIRKLGWKPKTSLQEGIKKTHAYYRASCESGKVATG